eukprot:CCRYP_014805-RA/>CCRYP_014805-RA protein AED:0.07 eAED:0.07 QI:185/0.75/0.88/1/1/0.88/9/2294/790
MTISDEAPPQDRDSGHGFSSHLDIEDLVRALDEKARAAEERAKTADDRSLALAERVATLEDQLQQKILAERPSLFKVYESNNQSQKFSDRNVHSSERKIFANKEDAIQTVVGVREECNADYNDKVPYLAERLDLIERRLDECEDTKRGTALCNEFTLPQSTFSLLVTEHPLSSPFIFAVFTATLSITCLGLVLADAVSNGTAGNRLNVPPGVSSAVRGAQFVGLLVGVLFEDECPQGLQNIAQGAGHTLLLDGTTKIHKRLIAVSILRLVVGYLFLSSLFINVVQNSDVIAIFYDVLALEFVENIDDTAFALAMKGFLGQRMLVATVKKHTLKVPIDTPRRSIIQSRDLFGDSQRSVSRGILSSGSLISNSRSNYSARFIYFLNAIVLLVGLTYISIMQSQGEYRCRRLNVSFNEEIWKTASIALPDGSTGTMLLVYPYFNGIYAAEGSVDGHPRYVEQDKFSGSPFVKRKGAEIRYCEEIESWVFMHPEIMTSNECGWLFRSYQVSSETNYDIINAANDPWIAWTGEVVWDSSVTIECTSCSDDSDCSYQGSCKWMGKLIPEVALTSHFIFDANATTGYYGVCSCNNGRSGSPGSPGEQWVHDNSITLMSGQVYSRPVYIQTDLTDDPFDWRKFETQSPRPTFLPLFKAETIFPTVLLGETLNVSSSPTFTANFTPPYPAPMNISGSFDDSLPNLPVDSPPLYGDQAAFASPTDAPTKPWYIANEYELDVEDFAEHDDFFESKPLHDLDDIMQNYSVVLSFTGSRFYATIVEPDATFNDIFPQDYHVSI